MHLKDTLTHKYFDVDISIFIEESLLSRYFCLS